jgi:branched-subunit amino acid ABC-type transport system permease component
LTLKLLVDSLVATLQVGSLYALMAIGLTLTFAVMRLPNFAHAELITVGAYAALVASLWLTQNPLLLGVIAFLTAALTAFLCHRAVYRPLARMRPPVYIMILASFAVGLILRYLLFIFADGFELFDLRIAAPQSILLQTGVLTITSIFTWVAPTSIALVLALSLLLNRTSLGRQMRALADNTTLARVIGVPVHRIHDVTWLLAGGLAGVGGAFWGLSTFVNPLTGWLAILSVFAATVLGGMTSFVGAILGAYLVAFAENTVMQLLNAWLGVSFAVKPAIPFVIIILVLLIRPQGLRRSGA